MKTLVKSSFPSLLDEILGEWETGRRDTKERAYSPDVEIQKSEKAYKVTAPLAGVKKENLNVQVENGRLVISGTYENKSAEEYKTVHSEVTNYKEFYRELRMDAGSFQVDKIDAQLENGVLTLTLPLVESVKPRQIDVKVR